MSIGEALASARQERGLTVEDVSQATRIRGTLIRAIERDDFSLCGGGVYARGHIRSIARAVGVDPEPLVGEFDETHDTPPQLVTDSIFEAETRSKPERTGPRWGFAMAAAVLVAVCAAALVSILSAQSGQPTAQHGPGTGPSASVSTKVSHHPTTRPSRPAKGQQSEPPVAQERTNGVNLRIRITGARSWLSVRNAAGATLLQQTLSHGQVFDAHDPRLLRLVVGDAGAVDLIVNGKELGPPGHRGAVVNLTFHRGDPATASQG